MPSEREHYLCSPTPNPFSSSLQLGSVSCQVANALSNPSQPTTLEVVWGQIASRANGTSCSIKPSGLSTHLQNISTVLKKGGRKYLFPQKFRGLRLIWGERFHRKWVVPLFSPYLVVNTTHLTDKHSRNPFRICLDAEHFREKCREGVHKWQKNLDSVWFCRAFNHYYGPGNDMK